MPVSNFSLPAVNPNMLTMTGCFVKPSFSNSSFKVNKQFFKKHSVTFYFPRVLFGPGRSLESDLSLSALSDLLPSHTLSHISDALTYLIPPLLFIFFFVSTCTRCMDV